MSLLSLLMRPRSFEERLDIVVVEYLVVAGGGCGGQENIDGQTYTNGGGGGAGGALAGETVFARKSPIGISVGDGGFLSGLLGQVSAGNSTLGPLIAFGGGAGGNALGGNGQSGGSGGGGAFPGGVGGSGVTGQGMPGVSAGLFGSGPGGSVSLSSIIAGGSPVTYALGGDVASTGTVQPPNTGNGGAAGGLGGGCYEVSGAGTEEYNGIYCPTTPTGPYSFSSGTFTAPAWRKGGTDKYIYLKDGIVWTVGTLQPFEAYYLNSLVLDDNGIPIFSSPSFAVVTTVSAQSPAPSIQDKSVFNPAQSGASGVVVIAYPDALPAITISGGLTYDQPTRSGYRVYRFTAGSGTIAFP